ncbi:MAG: hypothetical protein QXS85_02670 [Acidilobaceae archaeon]
MKTAVEPAHGSIVYSVDGLVAQALGIPHAPELIPVIPKYVLCNEGAWSRPASRLCRVIDEYGPRGLSRALSKLSSLNKRDGVYGALVPYVERWRTLLLIDPREALEARIRSPRSQLDHTVLRISSVLRSLGVSLGELGLTGSLAAGIENPKFSDVDLVVYGARAARRVLEFFESSTIRGVERREFGGLSVNPPVNTSWRRARLEGVEVSWVGVPLEGELCTPLESYFKVPKPEKHAEKVLRIEPEQEESLLYPLCVKAETGEYLVSFEYNIAIIVYKGGVFRVKGLVDENETVVYLGLRELPGELSSVDQ